MIGRFSQLRGGLVVFAVILPLLALTACKSASLGSSGGQWGAYQAPPHQAHRGGSYKVGSPYQIKGRWYHPREDYNYREIGIASWYGPNFHGKRTANGEVFDENLVTAAHRTLPMPSLVKVTNLENGRELIVRVNDRGPFADNRIIDLSRRSAQLLGMEKAGLAKVRVEILPQESRLLAQGRDIDPRYFASSGGGSPPVLASTVKATSTPQIRPTLTASGISTAVSLPPLNTAINTALPVPSAIRPAMPVISAALPQVTISAPMPVMASPTVDPVSMPATSAMPESSSAILASSAASPVISTDTAARYYVQVGAFRTERNAQLLGQRLEHIGPIQVSPVEMESGILYRLRLGPAPTATDARLLLSEAHAMGHGDAQIIRYESSVD